MKIVLGLFVSLLLISNVEAQDFESKSVSIEKNQPAPFSGLLLNSVAIAKILTEKEYLQKKCILEKEYENNKIKSKCELDGGNIKIELDILKKKYDVVNQIKNDEINKLYGTISKFEQSDNYKWIWFVGGVFLGVSATVGTAYAVSHAVR